ncbi:MAG: hypothetical protein RLY16_2053 [Bacteroidota bacterium]|jgi:hypothetical protein
MLSFTKKTMVMLSLVCATLVTLADRGVGKKAKAKANLNITTTTTLKNSISANLKSGLTYKGSLFSSRTAPSGSIMRNLVTYQKGNTTYIIPYKQKVAAVPEMRQGYTGMKIILRRNH